MQTRVAWCKISSLVLEIVFFVTFALFFTGHAVNWLTSPKPLNPFWNPISGYAASTHGGLLIKAMIVLYAVSMLLFGMLNLMRVKGNVMSELGGSCMAIGSVPMILVAIFPTFTPQERNLGFLESLKYNISGWLWGWHSAGEQISNGYHMRSISIAAMLFGLSILPISISFLGAKRLDMAGKIGIGLLPLFAVFYHLSSNNDFYPGLWQRLAFLLLFLWMLFATHRLRTTNSKSKI